MHSDHCLKTYGARAWSVVLLFATLVCANAFSVRAAEPTPQLIDSLAQLADYAGRSGQHVKMQPGVYQLADLLPPEVIDQRRAEAVADAERRGAKKLDTHLFRFAGSDNTFDLSGVTIEVDTRLLSVFKNCYIRTFLIAGDRITLRGLTVRDLGNGPTSRGGNSLSVHGDDVTLENVVLHVRGSYPYGYGDLLGKGGKSIVRHRKHSGLLVCGTNTRLVGCKVYSRAFGHLFYVQGGRNITFEDCYAEGELRSTDEMLAETEGPAFENGFKSVYKPNVIQPGYIKSLNECGFRTYGRGGPEQRKTGVVTLVNCVAKNVRVGFAFALKDGARSTLQGCEAVACERGYYLRGANVTESRGDAQYGPLLYLVGERSDRCVVDLTLTSATSDVTVHALATLSGEGHRVTLRADVPSPKTVPIMIGFNPPGGGENSAPLSEGSAKAIHLTNHTAMPVVLGAKSNGNRVVTEGPVLSDAGNGNRTRVISPQNSSR